MGTSESEKIIRTLFEISTESDQGLEHQIHRLLELGCSRFNLEIGILSRIVKNDYEVMFRHCPVDMPLNEGDHFELGNTYCTVTVSANQPVGFEHIKESEIKTHPAYKAFGLEAYIGTPILVKGEVFGTLNFSSPTPLNRVFKDIDVDALQLMASWVGNELSRIQTEEENKRQQIALLESETKLRGLYELSPLGIALTDMEGRYIEFNEAFRNICGYPSDELLNLDYWTLTPKKFAEDEGKQLELLNQTGHYGPYEKEYLRKDGVLIPIRLNGLLIQDHTGRNCIWSIVEDISEQQKAEEKFRQAQKMEALGTLVGGIAHDFNNMLGGMVGNLYLAKKKAQDLPDVVAKLDNVSQLSFRAAEMIQQLLIFARRGVVEMKPFGLTSFMKEAFKLNAASIPESITIHDDFCRDELVVKGDATQLQQVLMNLLNNSRDALIDIPNPEITLKLEEFNTNKKFTANHPHVEECRFAHLILSDNGSGISNKDQEHIFEPFYTTKEVGRGTGLGLSMAFGAIQSHGGILEVESRVDSGTTIHIYLPLLTEHKVENSYEEEAEAVSGRGESILIVDDNADILETTKEVLEDLGYQVLKAKDGLDAVGQFTSNQDIIQLVVMDVVMPRLGGVKAVERIKEIHPDIKVIFATGYDKDEALESEMPSEEYAVLSKPYNIPELSKLIRDQLDS